MNMSSANIFASILFGSIGFAAFIYGKKQSNFKALVIGVNGTGIDEIKQGKLLATGDYKGFQQGCLGTMAAIRHLRKLPVPAELMFPPNLITQANVQSFLEPKDKMVCPKWEDVVKK